MPCTCVCLACSASAGADSGSGLKTHCLLLKNISRHGWRLFNSGIRCQHPAATTGQITSDVVTDIERAAEKFRRHVISLCDQIVALLGERNNSNGIRFDFNLQSRLIGDVTQRFAKWNVIQCHSDARASRACTTGTGGTPAVRQEHPGQVRLPAELAQARRERECRRLSAAVAAPALKVRRLVPEEQDAARCSRPAPTDRFRLLVPGENRSLRES